MQLYDAKGIILEQKHCRWHMTTIKLIIIILIFKSHFFATSIGPHNTIQYNTIQSNTIQYNTIISLLKVNKILKLRYTVNYNIQCSPAPSIQNTNTIDNQYCCIRTIILLYTCATTINHSLCIDESLLLFPLLHATIVECSTCL